MWLLALVARAGRDVQRHAVFRGRTSARTSIRLDVPDPDSRADERQAFHIDFVMGVAGLITMLVWGSLTPDRRDAHVLGPLPITSREQAYGTISRC